MPRAQRLPDAFSACSLSELDGVRECEESLDDSGSGRYEVLRQVGRGCFGKAMLVRRKGSHDPPVVAKRMSLEIPRRSEKHFVRMKREIDIMKAVNHPHAMSLLDYWRTARAVYLVMEYAEYRDLSVFIRYYQQMRQHLLPIQVVGLTHQISSALEYLHSVGVMHRDLKPANIFMMSDCYLKLGDFGFSFMHEANTLAASRVGTPYYQAPEVVENLRYSYPCDMWSLGVVMYELLYLRYPFEGDDIPGLYKRVVAGRVRHTKENQGLLDAGAGISPLSVEEGDLRFILTAMNGCLRVDQKERLTAVQMNARIAQRYPNLEIPDYREGSVSVPAKDAPPAKKPPRTSG